MDIADAHAETMAATMMWMMGVCLLVFTVATCCLGADCFIQWMRGDRIEFDLCDEICRLVRIVMYSVIVLDVLLILLWLLLLIPLLLLFILQNTIVK